MSSSSSRPPSPVAAAVTREAQRKRRRIAGSLWPRAALFQAVMRHRIRDQETFEQAAALTYKTLFSLIPVFVLAMLILSAISTGGGKNALDSTVQRVVFQQLNLDTLPVTDDHGKAMVNPDTGKEVTLAEFIAPMLERAKRSVTSRATGIVALAILVYGAISLMIVIEGAFNQIYGSAKARSFPRRIMLYWCVLTLGPIGVAGSIVLAREASKTAQTVAPLAFVMAPLQSLSGFLVMWLLVLLMFKLIPDTFVKWRSALVGSLVAAVLWEIGKWGFGLYVAMSVHRGSWYGSLALVPLFMLWIYLTWIFILMGLHMAYAHQYYPMLKRQYFYTRNMKAPISDIRWVLSLGIVLYKRFREGKAVFAHEAAEELLLPTDIVGQMLEGLRAAGVAQETARGGYVLGRPPEAVSAWDLLEAGRALCQMPPELAREHASVRAAGRSAALDDLDALERQWAKGHSLAGLAGE